MAPIADSDDFVRDKLFFLYMSELISADIADIPGLAEEVAAECGVESILWLAHFVWYGKMGEEFWKRAFKLTDFVVDQGMFEDVFKEISLWSREVVNKDKT